MKDLATMDDHGTLTEPTTLRIQRILPGPIERIWAYLTESDLRRRWLAAGDMKLEIGAPFAFTWRNDELTDPPGIRPEGMSADHRMESRIIEIDPPRRIGFAWDGSEGVSIELAPRGDAVLLTLTHKRVARRSSLVGVSTGWHMHLDVLVAVAEGATPTPFWDRWADLRAEYEARTPT
jgi:uncharacterized protein YndB with AHSA1/START domain